MYKLDTSHWHILRMTHLLGGTLALAGSILALTIHPLWLLLPAFVGTMQVIFAFTGFCPSAILMEKMGIPRS